MSSCVLDSSAVLALAKDEPGAERVAAVLTGAAISAVNYSEVVAKLTEWHFEAGLIDALLGGYKLKVVPFDSAQARAAGLLRAVTMAQGLSFGDRACLALAAARGAPVLTTDRRWGELHVDVDVQVIR